MTTTVTLDEWSQGDDVWQADIFRESADAPGDVSVYGNGDVGLALFYASKACFEQAGHLDTAAAPFVTELSKAGLTSFKFREACK